MITVKNLNIYPIKSCAGIAVNTLTLKGRGGAIILSNGIEIYDRQWMLVSSKGQFLSQRELPEMARMLLEIQDNHMLIKHHSTQERFALPVTNTVNFQAPMIDTLVWGNHCQGYDEGEEVAKWFTSVLGKWQNQSIRLIKFNPTWQREVKLNNPLDAQPTPTHTTHFSDTSAYLITNRQSLIALNKDLDKISMNLSMNRFRANIVVDGIPAWSEHTGSQLKEIQGRYVFSIPAPCPRCKITTIDQQTAHIAHLNQPLQTIRSSNPHYLKNKNAYFGQHGFVCKGEGEIMSINDAFLMG